MRSGIKLVFLSLVLLLWHESLAQQKLRIQKNNTYTVKTITLPKKAVAVFIENGSEKKIRGKILSYRNHSLVMLAGSDTVRIGREQLTRVRFKNHVAILLSPAIALTALFTGAGIGAAIADPKESGFVVPFVIGMISGYATYRMIGVWAVTLNMSSEWSLIDE